MPRPVCIDLFAGAGGLSLGFEQSGFDVAAAVEIDPVHCAAHKFNFPQASVIPYSVEVLNGEQIRELSNLGDRSIDVLCGGAPCQGFSLIGKRVLDDPRNKLVSDFLRLAKELNVKYFVFENVKGLTLGRHRKFLDEFIQAAAPEFEIVTPWKVLNAMDYGVPQSRERLFLLGYRAGLKAPDYPQESGFRVTCSEALSDLPNVTDNEWQIDIDSFPLPPGSGQSSYAKEMACMTKEAWHNGIPRKWNRNILTSSAPTKHTAISRRRIEETAPGKVEPISRFRKLEEGGVSNTLRAGTDSKRGAFTSPRPIHYKYPRVITVREMARLHGFPDWFRFHVTKWHGARQIGNAVPPPLARAVAHSIMRALDREKDLGVSAPSPINLGDSSLLHMTVSEAAKHFGVPAPDSRRDQKSGTKKRKQDEIEQLRLLTLERS